MRAAIYARFSTDKQRETSIEDQLRQADSRAEYLGLQVVARHTDSAISASTPIARRAGGKALLADVLAGRFEVLIVEGLDRLSREMGEQEQMIKRLEHRGVRIIGISDGYDSEAHGRKIMRMARGMVNELYLDDLKFKTHRGLKGQVQRGFHGGGLSYGYKSVAAAGGNRLEIDPAQAKWVVWMFERYVEGWSTRRIASRLNELGVKSARGSTWAASAIHGRADRQSGVLHNMLYIGRKVWNRAQFLKDPDTGRRQRGDRPREEWIEVEQPELRIVPADLLEKAHARMSAPTSAGGRGKGARTRTLFGGLLRCGHCGGAVIAVDARAYGCNTRKERGAAACEGVHARRDRVDQRLIAWIRDDLRSPAELAEFRKQLQAVLMERANIAGDAYQETAKRRRSLQEEITRLVDAVANAGHSAALLARLAAAEADLAALPPEQPAPLAQAEREIDDAVARYNAQLLVLQAAMESDVERARAIFKDWFDQVTLVRDGTGVYLELGEPAEALMLEAAGGSLLGMVAGTRFHTRNRFQVG